MKYKKIIAILLNAFLIMFLSGCYQSNAENKSDETKIVVATDLHYYSKELYDDSKLFTDMIENGDGKLVQYSTDITDALIDEVINERPSAFIISGDLTLNGEKISHEELSKKLNRVKKEGISVLVIPGNHDINSNRAFKIVDDRAYTTENISPEDFRKLYKNLGFSDALYKDESTLSYVSEISKDLWILILDTNQNRGYISERGSLSDATLAWIEQCLMKAKEKNATIISVTHQNLLSHNILFTKSFTIKDNDKLVELLEKYDVKLNLSGHMHIQHIAKSKNENGIIDIASSSLSVNPNQYGIVNISNNNEMDYKTQAVNMEDYVASNKINDENLRNFKNYSEQFFNESSYSKIYESLADIDLTESERKNMTIFASRLNMNYFKGTEYQTLEEDKISEEYKLWRTKGDGSFFYDYLYTILKEKPINYNEISIYDKP